MIDRNFLLNFCSFYYTVEPLYNEHAHREFLDKAKYFPGTDCFIGDYMYLNFAYCAVVYCEIRLLPTTF